MRRSSFGLLNVQHRASTPQAGQGLPPPLPHTHTNRTPLSPFLTLMSPPHLYTAQIPIPKTTNLLTTPLAHSSQRFMTYWHRESRRWQT